MEKHEQNSDESKPDAEFDVVWKLISCSKRVRMPYSFKHD